MSQLNIYHLLNADIELQLACVLIGMKLPVMCGSLCKRFVYLSSTNDSNSTVQEKFTHFLV